MKILYIAPLPPPLAGHSLVAKVFHDELVKYHEVRLVNFNKQSFKDGVDSFKRVLEILYVLYDVWRKRKGVDAIYLTISESVAGNLKDLFIYLICFRSLGKMYIHLHGGTIKKELWDKHKFIHRVNKHFIKKMAGVIISGKSHLEVFNDIVPLEKIHFVSNFALDYLFVNEADIIRKFSDTNPLRILYMSNMIEKKGYNDLADGWLLLNDAMKKRIRIDFAGRFEAEEQKDAFLKKIRKGENLTYHGVVEDDEKKSLFANAHIFCLPTAYFEGQPVSIPEGYASGCVIITTGQPGILDIFEPGVNGFLVEPRNPSSISSTMEHVACARTQDLLEIALLNRKTAAEKFRIPIYNSDLRAIIEATNDRS